MLSNAKEDLNMGILKDLGMRLYKAKMAERRQTEKAENSTYSIDFNSIKRKQEDKRRLELRKKFWETKVEVERLKKAGFSDYDIKELCHLTDYGLEIMRRNFIW